MSAVRKTREYTYNDTEEKRTEEETEEQQTEEETEEKHAEEKNRRKVCRRKNEEKGMKKYAEKPSTLTATLYIICFIMCGYFIIKTILTI
jgi:hypothetical protein